MSNSLKVFAGTNGRQLAQKIVDYLGIPLGDSSIQYFSDGEIWVKYNENIRGCDVFYYSIDQFASQQFDGIADHD